MSFSRSAMEADIWSRWELREAGSEITDMFFEVELYRDVAVAADKLERNGAITRRSIITRLLEDLLGEKASKDHGYFLAVTRLNKIGKGEVVDESGDVVFPVTFKCRTFMPLTGETLQGVVHHILRHGVFVRCGPIKYAFLSAQKMPGYHYVAGDNPVFLSDDLAKIETDVVVRFKVLGVRWIEKRWEIKTEFVMLASLEGSYLILVHSKTKKMQKNNKPMLQVETAKPTECSNTAYVPVTNARIIVTAADALGVKWGTIAVIIVFIF